jgi:hypothetical protein
MIDCVVFALVALSILFKLWLNFDSDFANCLATGQISRAEGRGRTQQQT